MRKSLAEVNILSSNFISPVKKALPEINGSVVRGVACGAAGFRVQSQLFPNVFSLWIYEGANEQNLTL